MPDETVVLVHGIYMNGIDMLLLKMRLERAGYKTNQFSYRSLRSTPAENAMDLHHLVQQMNSPVIHFVCHSLGGLVARHLFSLYPDQKPGHVVTLGTPHTVSSAARELNRFPGGKYLLGKSMQRGLQGNVPPWPTARKLGSVAGTLRLGLGMLIPGIPKPNDGTVAVEETKFAGMSDHIVLPVSHFGMLLSKTVAGQTIHFLSHGCFKH